MRRTNTTQAKEEIKAYILAHANYEDLGLQKGASFEVVAQALRDRIEREVGGPSSHWKNRYEMFQYWCSGLPGALDTCYYYNRSAVDDLGDICGETKEERSRYSEAEAEDMLTRLLCREIYGAKEPEHSIDEIERD